MPNDFSIIGKPTAMIDAAEKTTGGGKYTDDLSVPGMLIGKILHSPYPHALSPLSSAKTRPIPTEFSPLVTTSTRWRSIKSAT
jgi:hypothetical protein